MFQQSGEATVFMTLDANWGYCQIPVALDYREKTAFIFHAGIYRFKRMPFGLTSAPAFSNAPWISSYPNISGKTV